MIDIKTAIRNTPRKIQRKANSGVTVRVKFAFRGHDKDGDYAIFRGVAIDSLSQWRRPHIFTIKRYEGDRTSSLFKAICDCENYKYVWEVALMKQKSAVKCYSNGKKPVITNPRMKPGICKHLVAALKVTMNLTPTKRGKIFVPRGF